MNDSGYDKTKINDLMDAFIQEIETYRKADQKIRSADPASCTTIITNRLKDGKFPVTILLAIIEIIEQNNNGNCPQCGHKWLY